MPQSNYWMNYYRSGGKGVGAGVSTPLSDWQAKFDEAKATNEQRYSDILKGYQERYKTSMDYLSNLGVSEGERIRTDSANALSKQQQQLAASGLWNSGNLAANIQGANKNMSLSLNDLAERIAREKGGVSAQLSGDTLGFMERREDLYPDYNLLAQLYERMGAAGGGSGSMVKYTGATKW